MPEAADLLFEIGTEELPPESIKPLSIALGDNVAKGLEAVGLSHGVASVFATPRRLAVLVADVQKFQDERQVERRGPAFATAFDADGSPTRAALGFASSCGVEVERLERLETEKGSWLVFRTTEVGQTAASLLPDIVSKALTSLPLRRRMRWSNLDAEFVRPVHWIVLLHGDDVVKVDLLGVSSGRHTRGHRFHQPNLMSIDSPEEYASLLYSRGHVVADFATRMSMIRKQVEEATIMLGGVPDVDAELLEEVTSIVEWPVPIVGSFDEEFLALPSCVLVATMRGAQRYFHVRNGAGNLLSKFITIANIESRKPESVRDGNERVIRPRLKDAAFFFESDQRQKLEARLEAIKQVKFQEKLGSVYDESQRISKLCAHIAIAMGQDPDGVRHARRAGLLCKCDLATAMVGEFPELQGEMGREYARLDDEPAATVQALGELYQPRFARDGIPASPIGRALAMADKLDTLAGIFGIGQLPSGDKDPFALRRAALGVLRILIEGELNLELPKLIAAATAEYKELLINPSAADQLLDFMMDRLRAYFIELGTPVDVFGSVMTLRPTRPFDFARRVRAVAEFRGLQESASLAAANKRIQNILKQNEDALPDTVRDELFTQDAEWNLAAKLVGLSPRVKSLLGEGDYAAALGLLASLRDAVDAFFDTVKVMDENEAVRRNRLALLNNISVLFLATADISQLQT